MKLTIHLTRKGLALCCPLVTNFEGCQELLIGNGFWQLEACIGKPPPSSMASSGEPKALSLQVNQYAWRPLLRGMDLPVIIGSPHMW